MKLKTTLIASALLLALSASASAAEWTLPASGAGDSVPTQLSNRAAKASTPLETAPVQFAWRLDPAAPLQALATPPLVQSREYWDKRSSDEMAAGVPIPTTSPGAIVRLSPSGTGAVKALEARQVILLKDGRSYANAEGMRALADSETLEKGSAPFPAGSTVFRIDPSLGAGAFELKVAGASGDTIVHIFEADSTRQLELKADRIAYQAGQSIRIDAALRDGTKLLSIDELGAFVVSPGGQMREVRFEADKSGGYRADLPADFSAEAGIGGLFEVQVFASAIGGSLQRDARTAFAYSVPTARLTGSVRSVPLRMRDPYVSLEFDLEVAAAGRYQLGAVLYGTDKTGAKVPVAMAQSARALEAGVQSLQLLYGPDVLDGIAAGAPWELRDVQLIDQATMGVQEQRVRGLELGSAR